VTSTVTGSVVLNCTLGSLTRSASLIVR
jgi:hypothetical protein